MVGCPPFGWRCPPFGSAWRDGSGGREYGRERSEAASRGQPPASTVYWDYLLSIPVGARMEISLSGEPRGTLGEDNEKALFFVVTRVGEDAWTGVRSSSSSSSTRVLFVHVRDVLAQDDEDVILVSHGRDPKKVKSEIIYSEGDEPQQIKLFTITEVIELDSDSEEGEDTGAGVGTKQMTTRCALRIKPG